MRLLKILKPEYLPRISIVLIAAVILFMDINAGLWNKEKKVIASDVKGYYTYLPAIFIYKDIALDFINDNPQEFRDKIWFLKTPTGKKAIQYTCGQAMLYTPFFLLAHGIALITPLEADGYSAIYKIALLLSSLFYLLVALHFLSKLLKRYFDPMVTALALFLTVVGTNLLYYATYEAPMTHAYNFAFIAVFLFLLDTWLRKPNIKYTCFLGLVSGLIALIRPTNALILLFIPLWGIKNFKDILHRMRFLLRSWPKILLMIFMFFLVWLPQFFYWKYISGEWLFFSYGDRAWFFFNDPELINILFSYRKGWFLYTPLMLFACIGIAFLYRKYRELFFPVLLFTLLNVYILASWCFWWYGGSFGLRTFVDSYALLAFPLAALISFVMEKKKVWIASLLLLFFVLTFHNTFQIEQYRKGAIHYVSMTKEAYWESFGKLRPTKAYYDALEFPDYKAVENRIKEARNKREAKRK